MRRQAMKMKTSANNNPSELLPFLTFILGGRVCALPIAQVVEVVAMVDLVKLPDTRPELLGMANRHGAVIPMLDMSRIFGQPALTVTPSTLFIVAEAASVQVGLVVDEVLQVAYFDVSQMSPSPVRDGLVGGVIPDRDRLIQVVDLTAVLAASLPADFVVSDEKEK